MKVCITGIKGFVGKNLSEYLRTIPNVEIVYQNQVNAHLSNFQLLAQNVGDFDVMIHLAASNFVPDSYTNPQHFYSNNLLTTVNALELCRVHDAKLVYMSSYLYGHPQYLPIDELHPTSSTNVYTHSKLLGESICEEYAKIFGVKTIALRPFNIYGIGQSQKFLIPTIINQALTGHVTLMDARPKRDYIHVSDVVRAIYSAATYDCQDTFTVVNIANGISYSISDIIEIVKLKYPNIEVDFKNIQRPNEILDTVANISKAKNLLDWQPSITFVEGLTKIINQ